jgi:hypothetical protein
MFKKKKKKKKKKKGERMERKKEEKLMEEIEERRVFKYFFKLSLTPSKNLVKIHYTYGMVSDGLRSIPKWSLVALEKREKNTGYGCLLQELSHRTIQ